jgi:hypothetical protein
MARTSGFALVRMYVFEVREHNVSIERVTVG